MTGRGCPNSMHLLLLWCVLREQVSCAFSQPYLDEIKESIKRFGIINLRFMMTRLLYQKVELSLSVKRC